MWSSSHAWSPTGQTLLFVLPTPCYAEDLHRGLRVRGVLSYKVL